MKLIVTHEQPDFDALASLTLARLIHPGFRAALHGGLDPDVAAFTHLYRDLLELERVERLPLAEVDELIVVDTADRRRIGPFAALVDRVPVTLYDHHPPAEVPIPAGRGLHEEVGATTTLLTRLLRSRELPIPPSLASLALLGIHQDTGNLTFPRTRPDDYRAAAYLMRCGASLELVRAFSREVQGEEHRAFRARMTEHAREERLAGHDLVTAAFSFSPYLPGVSRHSDHLREIYAADAALVAVAMEGKTLVFARSGPAFDVGAALGEALGGGGHPGAAFARTDLSPDEALARARPALAEHARPNLQARELMSAPVKTVREDATVTEAQRLLVLYGHNGLPVLDAGGRLVGVLSRRDLERALRHALGSSLVSGFMSRKVVSATPDTPLERLEALVMRHNIGRLPILEGGRLVGIVTRSDLITARHRARPDAGPAATLLARLPGAARALLERVVAEAGGARVFLVGGTVRDGLLGVGFKDLDVAIEGPPERDGAGVEALATRLQAVLGGRLSCHLDFGTCTLQLPDGSTLDLATTREEIYPQAGALPEVRPSTLRRDLARRDFSVNALAVRLAPEPAELLDPYGGLADLEARRLRVLHPLSFIEDPTRIVRGARLAGRLGFRLEEATRERARAALEPELLAHVSHGRLRAELELTLAEPQVAPALEVLERIGALATMYGLGFEREVLDRLDALRRREAVPAAAYLLALLIPLDDEALRRVLAVFNWPRRTLHTLERVGAIRQRGRTSDDELETLDEAGRALVKALGDDLQRQVLAFEQVPRRRKLRGQDVLDLGLSPGPEIGSILERVAAARAERRVDSFDDELALARRLVAEKVRGAGGPDAEEPGDRERE